MPGRPLTGENRKNTSTPSQHTQPSSKTRLALSTPHFTALFSQRSDATALLFLHGWPGSFLEFLPILSLLRKRYTPTTLPYHIIIPSLPGYGFSSPPPLTHDFHLEDVAYLLNTLMTTSLNLPSYIVQCGDIGSAYALLHAAQPATLGLALSSSSIALLAWIAERFLAWSDTPQISVETILTSVSLYWFTNTIATSLYPYRQLFTPGVVGVHEDPRTHIPAEKMFGFSWFPKELAPVPRQWVETTAERVVF